MPHEKLEAAALSGFGVHKRNVASKHISSNTTLSEVCRAVFMSRGKAASPPELRFDFIAR